MLTRFNSSAVHRLTSCVVHRRSSRRVCAPGHQITCTKGFSESALMQDNRSFPASALCITGRHYIAVAGIDRQRFLQGLCTNDVERIAPGHCRPAAFLNSKGRVVADSMIHRCELDGEEVFVIETDASSSQTLTQLLTVYKLRSRVKLAARNLESYEVLHLSEADMNSTSDSCSEARILSSCRDVRFEHTNARRILVSRAPSDASSSSAPAPLFSALGAEESAGRYEALRRLHGVAEGPDLIGRIPLECDLDELKYVDFEKGCYMGQELTARTKYKGIVKKRILPFVFSLTGEQYKDVASVSEFGYLRESEDALHHRMTSPEHPLAQELREASRAAAASGGGGGSADDSGTALPGNITCVASRGVVGSVIGSPAYYPTLGFGVGLAMLRLERIMDTSSFAQGFLLHSKLGTVPLPSTSSSIDTSSSSSSSSSGSGGDKSNLLSGIRCVPFRPKWFSDALLAEAKK